jgi:homoserine O-acetyltransferase/methionine biosynthesis protein MetW
MSDSFQSSDSVRSGQPLCHAQYATFAEELPLERGGRLPGVTVAYETYGTLNPRRDNAVLVCHALSGDSHVARHDDQDDPGWWELVVGPGKAIDTERYFVICPNILGGCRGTTGPNSLPPGSDRPYGSDFPTITVGDMVRVQEQLIGHLGIERLRAVIGGSLGGHMALCWATRYSRRVAGAVVVAASPRLTSQALAFDVVGRNAILRDPAYQDGQYYAGGGGPAVGLSLARMLGHITYLSREAMAQKFGAQRLKPRQLQTQFENKFAVGSYLAYQGDKFVERFDPNSYLTLTMAMDLFELGDTPAKLSASLAAAECRWLLLSFTSDWLFPAFQSQEMVDALIAMGKPVSYCNVQSDCGHDAFLLADNLDSYGEMIRAFLARLDDGGPGTGSFFGPGTTRSMVAAEKGGEHQGTGSFFDPPPAEKSGERQGTGSFFGPGTMRSMVETEKGACPPLDAPDADAIDDDEPCSRNPTSIFHRRRLDYDSILELIPPGSSVLDLGCGTGALLARLRQRGHRRIMGIELDERAILACIRRGLDVVQADLNCGLAAFADKQFDFVVLSQTLQAVLDVERVVADLLRVGRQGIVSFPNLGYRTLREQLYTDGRAPRAGSLLGYNWYDSPNVRFLTLDDFDEFCREKGITIHQRIALDTTAGVEVRDDPNLNADMAIVVISK